MMKLIKISSHWSPEEAYNMLMLLDNLRDVIWQNYREDIIEHCRQEQIQENHSSIVFDDDTIPF